MSSPDELTNVKGSNLDHELHVLAEVEISPETTQRDLSQKIGISLGLTNVIVRSIIRKGYVRSQQATWKRRAYFLTPEGFSRKIRLTVNYIRRFMSHYQNVRGILRKQLEPLNLHEESRVAIVGVGEFAELIYLGLKELHLNEIDVFSDDPTAMHMEQFLGMPVRNIASLNPEEYSRVLIARLNSGPGEHTLQMLEPDYDKKVVSFFVDDR